MSTASAYCDITNDVENIKTNISQLSDLLTSKSTTYYHWYYANAAGINGMIPAINNTLYNIARGLRTSILPAIENLGVATNQLDSIYQSLENSLSYTQNIDSNVSQIYTTLDFVRSDLNSIYEKLSDLSSQFIEANDHLTSIVGGIYEVRDQFYQLITTFDNYKSNVEGYLNSIDYNVNSIANNQNSYLPYLYDIYSYLQGGINVSVSSGFPEMKDYTPLLEKISNNSIWDHYTDWYRGVPNKYLPSVTRYWNYDNLATNTHTVQGTALSGDFFTDSVTLLSNSDTTLSDISKSLMILVQQSSSNNVAVVDIDKEAEDLTPTDAIDDPSNLTEGLTFPSSSGYLSLPDINGLSNKTLPTIIDIEFPHLFGDIGGGTASINVGKFASVFTTMRNICLFFYWGVTACLFVLLYRLFSKYVLGSLMKLAFSFVQKGKAV